MTPQELKDEILNGPMSINLASAWQSGNDIYIANTLNEEVLPGGYVESRKLISILVLRNLLGLVLMASRFQKLPDGSACPFQLFSLFVTVEAAIFGNITPPLQFEVALLTPALTLMQNTAPPLVKPEDAAALLAQEIRVSRATILGWKAVTIDDVAKARLA